MKLINKCYDSAAFNKTLEHLNLCIIRKWGHTDMGQRQALSSTSNGQNYASTESNVYMHCPTYILIVQ